MAEINGYECVTADKLERAINGSIGDGGKLQGGVGEEASDNEKLAQYDKLGGLILKGKYKVKMGSFYDFEKGQPKEHPEVILVLKDLEGNVVEIPEGKPLPLEVQAAESIKEKKKIKKLKVVEAKEVDEDDI